MNPIEIVKKHNEYRENTLNLQASENYLSPQVRWALSSDMASRYSMVFNAIVHGSFVHNAYGGTKFQEEIVEYSENMAKKIFGFRFANVKPISGHVAAMGVLVSLLRRGDKIMAISPEDGGYDGYSTDYLPKILGLKYKPLKIENMRRISPREIIDFRPRMIVLGASYILFPYNIGGILKIAREIDALVVYDASHVLGLLPSGFQKNIEKCDVVFGSTHKSYPGPQGGLILTNNEELAEKIDRNLIWKVQDNYHTNRIAALALSFYEFEKVAVIYGKRVSENSKMIAKTLNDSGLKIRYPKEFTDTHQILIDETALKENFGLSFPDMSKILEKNGIIIDSVGRIGTSELTWKGYKKHDMKEIGFAIVSALEGRDVRREVNDIVGRWDGKTMGENNL